MPPKTRNSKGRTEADYEALQRYIKNKVAEDKRAGLYPYEDWNYAGSIGSRARHNGQYHSSKNKQQNQNPPSRNHQESLSSPNIEQETSPHQTSNYSSSNSKILSNSPLVNVNSSVKGSTELSSSVSQNISSQEALLPLPIDTSDNSLLNSTTRGTLTKSIPSGSNDGEEASSLTQVYPISDSSTTDIDSAISDWITHDNLKISSEVQTTSYIHKDQTTLSTDETSLNIQQGISSHITSKASPSSDDSNHQTPAAIPSFLKETIEKLKTIIDSSVGTLPCLPEPSRKEAMEIINQMEVLLTQPLQRCQWS
ncbi:hypothetical protein AVEN_237162-1 [Araneus ventricosus]|uniref:Uncharacterized protein n=1 Tax=Araneus ventricosus TaxID=182803 RepID=A0A4Y2L9B2_ARAVE|nr:hypothetical protein AVEN_237162-1 [Araneus ventricosus]